MNLYKVVFLADDDIDDREVFVDAIKEIDSNVQCVCANDGEAALKILCGDIFEKPDLIFLDLNMPRLSGKQVLKELKERVALRDIPVIIYSTFIGKMDMEEIRRQGAVHFITKATEFDKLVAKLKFALTRKW